MSANPAYSEKPMQRHDAMLPYGKINMLLNNSSAWPSAGKSLVDDVPWYDRFFPVNPFCTGNGTHLDIYNVQRNDAAFFEPEMICNENCVFAGKKTRGKGLDCVL